MSDSVSGTETAPQDSDTTFPGQVTPEEVESESTVKGRNAQKYDDVLLRGITSFDDAVALATQVLGESPVDAAEEIGNGFTVLPSDDKARLVGVPFLILALDFQEGENGNYVTAMLVTQSGERLVLNDGSTGIYAQLEDWSVTSGRVGGLMVTGGLRRSEYERQDAEAVKAFNDRGVRLRATTYYLNV